MFSFPAFLHPDFFPRNVYFCSHSNSGPSPTALKTFSALFVSASLYILRTFSPSLLFPPCETKQKEKDREVKVQLIGRLRAVDSQLSCGSATCVFTEMQSDNPLGECLF